jgi:hypothetical protein
MVAQMEELRREVERHKEAAQRAHGEAAESRKSLAEMIESLRRERSKTPADPASEKGFVDISRLESRLIDNDETTEPPPRNARPHATQDSDLAHTKRLEGVIGPLTQQRYRSQALEHSAPYASMLGVVLLGVGIMAYLNSWQRVDK